jgi:hypothetical protein
VEENSVCAHADGAAFSFRWGIPVEDAGHTNVPNFFFDHYAEAGVTRAEFLVILHLARYQYERLGSVSRPSMREVARQMGYSARGLRKVLAGMETRGLLVRHYRRGDTTVYDFSGFSQRVLDAKRATELSTGRNLRAAPEEVGEGPQFLPGREPQCRRGWNHSAVKEENATRTDSKDGDDDLTKGLTGEQSESFDLLVDAGVHADQARELALGCPLDRVRRWIAQAERLGRRLANPAGFLVSKLRSRAPPPGPGPRAYDWRKDTEQCRRRYARDPAILT